MLHPCLVSTLLCFVFTLRYFYTLSDTNLLTRCHSAGCMFSFVFGSRKAKKSIFSELDVTKAKVIIFPRPTRNSRDEVGHQGGRTPRARASPCGAYKGCGHPGPPPTLP